MAPKRDREDEAAAHPSKKRRSGFKIGPDNLPDGTHRRKVIKIKKDLIQKVKAKKSYAKLKAREPTVPFAFPAEDEPQYEPATQELHPERQKMLEGPEIPVAVLNNKRSRKPGYFEKEKAFADQQKAEAEAKRLEFERRDRERKQKIEERERFRKAMAKARTGGKNGQRKLGRESKVLLERVKRMVGE